MTLQELRATRRDSVLDLAAEHGAYNVRVFGSVARGKSDPQSDVDFLVDLAPGRTISDLGGLLMDFQEALGGPGRCRHREGPAGAGPRKGPGRGSGAVTDDRARLQNILEAVEHIEKDGSSGIFIRRRVNCPSRATS